MFQNKFNCAKKERKKNEIKYHYSELRKKGFVLNFAIKDSHFDKRDNLT